MSEPPQFTVIAGPNGAGKSSLKQDLDDVGYTLGPYVNPDDIARTLPPDTPARDLVAGRETLRETRTLIKGGVTFSRESTLSSNEILRTMSTARSAGFLVKLFFVGIEQLTTSKSRVMIRTARGGHDIPEDAQERRFEKTFVNAVRATQIAHLAWFKDNTSQTDPHRDVAIAYNAHLLVETQPPRWFAAIAAEFPRWRRGVFTEIPQSIGTERNALLMTAERLLGKLHNPTTRFGALRELATLRAEVGLTRSRGMTL